MPDIFIFFKRLAVWLRINKYFYQIIIVRQPVKVAKVLQFAIMEVDKICGVIFFTLKFIFEVNKKLARWHIT